MLVTDIFSFFNMFSTLTEKDSFFLSKFILLSANPFNLDEFKILSIGKTLNLYHTKPNFNKLEKQVFKNIFNKDISAKTYHIFPNKHSQSYAKHR